MSQLRVTVDPYVALAILDHYMRRPEPVEPEAGKPKLPDRVTGILLGSTVKSELFVRNWVPSMDLAFIDLVQRSSAADMGVGWYTSSFLPEDVDGIHKTIIQKGIARPIILTVTMPDEKNASVTFRAFTTVAVPLKEGAPPAKAVRELPCVVASADNATAVAIDTMVSQLYPTVAKASEPARLPASTDSAASFAELHQVQANLKTARDYVASVSAGKTKADKETLRRLHELLITDRVAAASSDVVQEKLQDTMMLLYLSRVLSVQMTKLQQAAPLQLKG